MNFDSGTAYAESDADDEHSVHLVTDSEISPTDSDGRSSAEHTPTTYGHERGLDRLPEAIISEWTAEECAEFIATIGLEMYSEAFIENEIVGEALIALQHEDLKQMGIASVGHRLTILKSVYDFKKAQDIPMESDHYVPLTADAEAQYATATLKDIKHLVEQLRLRDERMSLVEQDLRRVTEEFRRLREDVLPVIRMAKEQQPLPNVNSQQSYGYESIVSPPAPTPPSSQTGGGLNRALSMKRIVVGQPPKSQSPTHLQSQYERSMEQTLDPSNAAERAVLSSSHLAAMNGGSHSAQSPGYSPNIPSPTSPPSLQGTTLQSRSYRSDLTQPPSSSRSTFPENDHVYGRGDNKTPAPRRGQTPAPDTPNPSNASVEIFKSFRVSMDDPCYKVLPAALKKYQINAPWDQYALYIVYGDQERCLRLDEKPLILFKQLDKEGKKPMFMLRKTNNVQVDLGTEQPGSAGLGPASARGQATGFDPPGGII
ncbi:protein kinase regulator ste50 (SAM domain-containing protein) [Zalerion maritima]|uniref:Protein kinase regulator ste50 (SAM domain-containing protein) n=1 Tax=Zalerion maritima TaxID=339359 RepID=A0AAD5RNT3_9PEZI|nr:protein kinase regulator ste50 (SAM domain-containing protein) [Zalerion maritima]